MKNLKSLSCAPNPEVLFSYRDPGQRSALALVAKWWAEAAAQGVKNPETWVARRCAEDIQRANTLIAAGKED
jgi:hypothetical protein